MKCNLKNIKKFNELINVTGNVIDEVKFEVDSEGIRWSGLDKPHISFINVDIESSFFMDYTVDSPETFTVDSGELVDVMKRGGIKDTLELSSDKNYLSLKFYNSNGSRVFKLRFFDMEYDTPTPPAIELPVTDLELDFKGFFNYIGDCEVYAEKLKFTYNNEGFNVTCDGELGLYDGIINIDNDDNVNVSSSFTIGKLNNFKKLNSFDKVYVSMGDNKPIILKVTDNSGVTGSMLIAPIFEEEE